MRKEKWIQINKIQGYEEIKDCYWISNADEDKVINRSTGKQLKVGLNGRGYPRVKLMTVDGKVKDCRIHVIKAKAFLYSPNPLTYNVIRHLNDIKIDNKLENLAFGTLSDNVKDCIRNGNFNYLNTTKNLITGTAKGNAMIAKKFSKPVMCIETGIIYPSAYEIERQTGINNGKINLCCNGKRHTAGGYHWKFVNKEVNDDDMECEQI